VGRNSLTKEGLVVAQRVHIVLEDDIDGGTAEETVTFALDGTTYEIDLSQANAAKLRDLLAPYVSAARRSTGRGTRKSRGRSSGGPNPSEIREWARAHGHTVSDRGRVPAHVREKYDAEN
jgi:nucleoid-associated protein Lsr2